MNTRRLMTSVGVLIVSLGVWAGAAVAAPPEHDAPTISGTPKVGQTLTACERHLEQQPDVVRLPVAAL